MAEKKKTATEMRGYLEYITDAYVSKIREEMMTAIHNEVLLSKVIDSPKELFRITNTINLTSKIRKYLLDNDLTFRSGDDFYKWLKTT